jgi:hypothetical protein
VAFPAFVACQKCQELSVLILVYLVAGTSTAHHPSTFIGNLISRGGLIMGTYYRYTTVPDFGYMYNVGINNDGTLHNPKGYPEDKLRKALEMAAEAARERRTEGAKRAAVTRKRRQAKMILQIATQIVEGRNIGPRSNCVICGRGLGDPESIQRGIGSECWQGVLSETERMRDQHQRQTVIDAMLTTATVAI